MEDFLQQFSTVALYLVVWGIVFAETGLLLGFFLPGDTLLFAAGLITAMPGGANVVVMAIGVVVFAVVGDQVGYTLGLRLGRPYVDRRGPRIRSGLVKAEEFYARFGWLAVVAARWIPWVRTFTPFVAGVARMPRLTFLSANVVGALVWGLGLVTLGYFAYQVTWLRDIALVVATAVVLASMLGGIAVWVRERRSNNASPRHD